MPFIENIIACTLVKTMLTEQYWKLNEKRFPQFASLSKRYMAIPYPSTAAPVERLFSIAGKIFRCERCSLSDDNFETLMIKCRSEI